MKTFDLNRTIHGVGDLSDGVLIATCLKNMLVNIIQIAPRLFSFCHLVMVIILMKLGYKSFEQIMEIIIESKY